MIYYQWSRGHTQLFWDFDQNTRQSKLNDLFVKYFGERSHGFFVEIGANNGLDCGVTTPLADLGWTGHFIEPDPDMARVCQNNHANNPNISTHVLAISNENGEGTLHMAGMGSTISEQYFQTAKTIGWSGLSDNSGKVTVTKSTLEHFLQTINAPSNYDLLSIDTEGSELDILEAFSGHWDQWRPKMIVIELTDEHPDFRNRPDWVERELKTRKLILDAGYKLEFKDEINSVYVYNEIKSL